MHVETRLVDFHLDRDGPGRGRAGPGRGGGPHRTRNATFLAGKAGHVKTILLNPDRIAAVCTDILDHYTTKVAPTGMKAQVVAFDRELVVAYEHELKRLIAERDLPYDVGSGDDGRVPRTTRQAWLDVQLWTGRPGGA
ncbi:MAG: hypothetical protein V9G09_11220 [Candidatus Nanopelagicales bacterium]